MNPDNSEHDSYIAILVLCSLLVRKKVDFSYFKRVIREKLAAQVLTEKEMTEFESVFLCENQD
jgi:hypothetical protein